MTSTNLDLDTIASKIFSGLESACHQFDHGWRLPVLSTSSQGKPESRIVVLRQVNMEERTFCCHTDFRSAKVRQLQEQPATSWVFYDASSRVQLRISGETSLHQNDSLADQLWQESDPNSLKLYLGEARPGSISAQPESNLPARFQEHALSREDAETGRIHFCVLQTQIQKIDWMLLRPEGNLRALFDWSSDQLLSNWLIP